MLNKTEANGLIGQMGQYPRPIVDKVSSCLSSDVRQKRLYQGVPARSAADPLLHRKAFIEYLTRHAPRPPGQSAYTMSGFLGKEGLALYKSALAEEVNSQAYRDALFNNSVRHYEGNALSCRVIIPFAGASATGKTHASSAVMDAIAETVGVTSAATGNDVLVVDGAIARSTSQVRDLVVRLATNQGCQQLNDLHNQSAELEKAKQCIQNVGFASAMHLMIIETFTKYGVSGGYFISFSSILKNIAHAKDAAVIFCRMKGHEVDSQQDGGHRFQQFRSLISKMGEKRAWWQKKPEKVSLDLSKPQKLPEFKAYVPDGFVYGDRGSKLAEEWVKKYVPNAVVLHVTNDLYAYKKRDENTWGEAEAADKDIFIFSKRVYDAWLNEPEGLSLPDYNEQHARDFGPLVEQQNQLAKVSSERDKAVDDNVQSSDFDATDLSIPIDADTLSEQDLDALSVVSASSVGTGELASSFISDGSASPIDAHVLSDALSSSSQSSCDSDISDGSASPIDAHVLSDPLSSPSQSSCDSDISDGSASPIDAHVLSDALSSSSQSSCDSDTAKSQQHPPATVKGRLKAWLGFNTHDDASENEEEETNSTDPKPF